MIASSTDSSWTPQRVLRSWATRFLDSDRHTDLYGPKISERLSWDYIHSNPDFKHSISNHPSGRLLTETVIKDLQLPDSLFDALGLSEGTTPGQKNDVGDEIRDMVEVKLKRRIVTSYNGYHFKDLVKKPKSKSEVAEPKPEMAELDDSHFPAGRLRLRRSSTTISSPVTAAATAAPAAAPAPAAAGMGQASSSEPDTEIEDQLSQAPPVLLRSWSGTKQHRLSVSKSVETFEAQLEGAPDIIRTRLHTAEEEEEEEDFAPSPPSSPSPAARATKTTEPASSALPATTTTSSSFALSADELEVPSQMSPFLLSSSPTSAHHPSAPPATYRDRGTTTTSSINTGTPTTPAHHRDGETRDTSGGNLITAEQGRELRNIADAVHASYISWIDEENKLMHLFRILKTVLEDDVKGERK